MGSIRRANERMKVKRSSVSVGGIDNSSLIQKIANKYLKKSSSSAA